MTQIALKKSLSEIQNYIELLASKVGLIVILLLAVLILLVPGMIREENSIIGSEGYYHFRIAEDIYEKGIPVKDDSLVFERNEFKEFGWPASLSYLSGLTGFSLNFSLKILLLFFGIVSIFLVFLVLKDFVKERNLTLFALIISPSFIYLFNVSNAYALPVILSLLGGYFLKQKRFIFAIISLLFIPLFSIGAAFLTALLLLFYFLHSRKKRLLILLVTLISIVSLFFFEGWNFNILSDLGVLTGVSIFALFIAFFGFNRDFREKQSLFLFLIFVVLLLFSFKFPWGIFYFNFLLALLTAKGLKELTDLKWGSLLVKNLTILILITGLIFSSVTYITNLADSEPKDSFFDSLEGIEQGSVVLSSADNGYRLAFVGFKVVADEFTKDPLILSDLDTMLRSKEDVVSNQLLTKYGVDYILVDEKMKENLGEDSVLWLLRYSERFTNLYSDENIDIWGYNRE